jgi:hypothetical protein
VTLKTLVTGMAAAAVVAGAAAGVTSISSSSVSPSPAITPVVWGIPMPEAPAPELEDPLMTTLNALGAPGLSASKAPYVEGGIGRIEGRVADTQLRAAEADGKFPLSFTIANIYQNDKDPVVTADVTATAATGGTATQNIAFVPGPSPTGWQMSKQSLMALMSSVG